MELLQQINAKCNEIQEILENWEFESLEALLEFNGAPERERASVAKAGEQEWRKQLGSQWGAKRDMGRPQAAANPEAGDVVQHKGVLYRLGEPTPQGDFTSVGVRDGRPGMDFLPQYLKKHFVAKVGKDGRRMWLPREA